MMSRCCIAFRCRPTLHPAQHHYQDLVYGQTMFVMYAQDGRRWTALKEKEYSVGGQNFYYTRLVKR